MRLRSAVAAVAALLLTTPAFAYRIAAWIPPWDSAALTSIQQNGGVLDEANPVWYSLNADGSIATNWNAENVTWRGAMAGARLVPTIQNIVNQSFDGGIVGTLLASEASRTAHVNEIVQLVAVKGLDGIDIDYEELPLSLRPAFTAFVQLLSSRLHAAGRTLSVTVYAKTSDSEDWTGAGGEDWPAINGSADSVKIMAYDYHWSTSGPGTITPLDWLDQVATYAESVITPSKIMIALPWYGYDWSARGGVDATFDSATKVAQNNGVAIARDASGEPNYSYAGGHTVFFQDATSYQRKVDVIRQKHGGIGGFANWCAGVEDPAIWNVLRAVNAVAISPLPADFSVSGAMTLPAQQGSAATSDYRIIPINDYAGTTSVTLTAAPSLNATLSAAALSTSSTLTLRLAPAAAGTFPVILHFASGALAHDMTVNVVVAAAPQADFSASGPASLTVQEAMTVSSDYRLSAINGFAASAAVTVSAASSLNATLSTTSIGPSAAVTLRLAPSAAGTFPLVLHFTSGSLTHDLAVSVTVTRPVKVRAVRR